MLSAQEKAILKQFKTSLKKTLGGRLVELKLFGSKARGDDQPDSDIDVLVIVATDDWRVCDTVYNVATDLLRKDGTPFLRNVSKDAISV
ncbi:MAG: nucleotidyltransferase domain-containing protein [Planctomycetota bacterium]|jgi:predicted nucleotidyltransferase